MSKVEPKIERKQSWRNSVSYDVINEKKPAPAPILAQNVTEPLGKITKRKTSGLRRGSPEDVADRSKRGSRVSIDALSAGISALNRTGFGAKLNPSLDDFNDTDHAYVLHPHGTIRRMWDIFTCIFVIYLSWTLPFYLAFDWIEVDSSISTFNGVLDVWFIIDIFLNFRTGVVEYGMVRMDPTLIVKKYGLSIWFPIDVLASLPLELLVPNSDSDVSLNRKLFKLFSKYCKLPKLLRITRLVKSYKRNSRYSGIFSLMAAYIFIVHISR